MWHLVHRPFMIFTGFATFASFISIMAYKNWEWSDPVNVVKYTHSIFGIVSISLVKIQVKIIKCSLEI